MTAHRSGTRCSKEVRPRTACGRILPSRESRGVPSADIMKSGLACFVRVHKGVEPIKFDV